MEEFCYGFAVEETISGPTSPKTDFRFERVMKPKHSHGPFEPSIETVWNSNEQDDKRQDTNDELEEFHFSQYLKLTASTVPDNLSSTPCLGIE